MKKLLFLLAATILVILVCVSCGNETTTPVTTTTKKPQASLDPAFLEGIDIMNGSYDYMAIDPTWNSIYGLQFENHHTNLNYRWALVFRMVPTDKPVQENLISNAGKLIDTYTWSVIINGEELPISEYDILIERNQTFVRLCLGEWAPAAGINEYDVKLKICEAATGKVAYWTWFTDPDWVGSFSFKGSGPAVLHPDEKPEGLKAIPTGSLKATNGPTEITEGESYRNLFDGDVNSKLCTDDVSTPIKFKIVDTTSYAVKGVALVGANDDEAFPERIPYEFTLYGSDDGKTWQPILTAARSDDYVATNYQEDYFDFTSAVSYTHYKLLFENQNTLYQFSELMLYYQ